MICMIVVNDLLLKEKFPTRGREFFFGRPDDNSLEVNFSTDPATVLRSQTLE